MAQVILNPKANEVEEIVTAMLKEEPDIQVLKLRWRHYTQMWDSVFDELDQR